MSDPVSIEQAVLAATEELRRVTDAPRLEAELLMARAIDMPRSFLFAHPEDTLDALARDRFEELVVRREAGEPMAYIMGIKEFWSRDFVVSAATLVPRPETELLVEQALEIIDPNTAYKLLDMGTGTGAIVAAISSRPSG